MIVRGADTGQIRLNLKPETLGNVRIFLNLKQGHIAGRIIVENSSVREVFQQNLPHLSRAFEEGGLELDTLDVTVADSGEQSRHGAQTPEGATGTRGAARSAEGFARTVQDVETVDVEYDLVNLIV
jgi:flagellar hook-length control protein FliK